MGGEERVARQHASGRLTAQEATFIPESERRKVYRVARVWLAIYAATLIACIATASILPAMFIGLPRLYGAWHHVMTGLTQHSGLAEDVTNAIHGGAAGKAGVPYIVRCGD